ncbi:hypothetical protein MKW98_025850 [Papaver atlanticum]|uniref:Uncharacterized protein n=1 Tax=Papaver atlanticum TaxID=357466 RepID=A0AAD4X3U4_9MAGN|nr:hypothetical protein MKW98_025850 [Papaver atlanticum]
MLLNLLERVCFWWFGFGQYIADTEYALLNTSVPSGLQIEAMSTQMLKVSQILTLVSALGDSSNGNPI